MITALTILCIWCRAGTHLNVRTHTLTHFAQLGHFYPRNSIIAPHANAKGHDMTEIINRGEKADAEEKFCDAAETLKGHRKRSWLTQRSLCVQSTSKCSAQARFFTLVLLSQRAYCVRERERERERPAEKGRREKAQSCKWEGTNWSYQKMWRL